MTDVHQAIRRYVPFWISIFVGIALWEAAGRSTSAAFMVPFSETLRRLWQLIVGGDFFKQLADFSDPVFYRLRYCPADWHATRHAARASASAAHWHRALHHDYLRDAARRADPVHLIDDGLRLCAQGAGGLFVRGIPGALQHSRRRAQHQAGTDRGRKVVPLQRVGAVARSDASLHASIHHDRCAPGDWPRAGWNGCGRIFPELDRTRPVDHGRVAKFRHCRRVRFDSRHRL